MAPTALLIGRSTSATTPAAVAVNGEDGMRSPALGEDGGEGGESSLEGVWSSASFMVTSCISCDMMAGEKSVELGLKERVKK